jgi:hypothetical protein
LNSEGFFSSCPTFPLADLLLVETASSCEQGRPLSSYLERSRINGIEILIRSRSF